MSQRRVALLLADGFAEQQVQAAFDALSTQGFVVDTIGPDAHITLTGEGGKKTITSSHGIAHVSVNDYLALVIPGGHAPARLRSNEAVVQFVRDFARSRKPIATIGEGPQLLISADVVNNRNLTASVSVRDELYECGAQISDAAIVSCGDWLSSRGDADLPLFCRAIVAQFDANADQSWLARGDVHPQPAVIATAEASP